MLGGVGMGLLGERAEGRDVAIGMVLSLSLGAGLLFLHFFTAYAAQATALLFGSILGVDAGTIWTLLGLGVASLAALAVIARPLLFASLQPELAEARGVPMRLVSVLFLAVVALATALCVQVVGVLLVFTLLVAPAAAAHRLAYGVGRGVALAAALAVAQAWAGLALAYATDWPVSVWITALGGAAYLLARVFTPDFTAAARLAKTEPAAVSDDVVVADRDRQRRRRFADLPRHVDIVVGRGRVAARMVVHQHQRRGPELQRPPHDLARIDRRVVDCAAALHLVGPQHAAIVEEQMRNCSMRSRASTADR